MTNVLVTVEPVVKKERKDFALNTQPCYYQLSIHFNNLFKCFRAGNEEVRHEWDQKAKHSTEEILNTIGVVIHQRDILADFFQDKAMRKIFPMEFRVQQLINHYGVEAIVDYIQLIYGHKVGDVTTEQPGALV